MFADDAIGESWVIQQRWPSGVCCPDCRALNVQTGANHPTMRFSCRENACSRNLFSAKTGTVMEGSKIGYQNWILAAFLIMTNRKSVLCLRLYRDLGITQTSAWFLAHRLREALSQDRGMSSGPVEVADTYVGGKRRNMSNTKRKELTGRGAVGKTAVVGAKDRAA